MKQEGATSPLEHFDPSALSIKFNRPLSERDLRCQYEQPRSFRLRFLYNPMMEAIAVCLQAIEFLGLYILHGKYEGLARLGVMGHSILPLQAC